VDRVAFVTHEGRPAGAADDELAARALRASGVAVESIPWDRPGAPWCDFDAVVLRSTWDYHRRASEFLAWLGALETAGARLWNPARLVRWNAHKRYLLDLEARGVAIVPTALVERDVFERDGRASLAAIIEERGWRDAVVKPAISANAEGTFRATAGEGEDRFRALLAGGDVLVQPFVPEIQEEGEHSFIFLGETLALTVRKRAASGDFRVQGNHGGEATRVFPGEALLARARAVVGALEGPWLYARVDAVRRGDELLLMELEAIEPELFLRLDAAAPAVFAGAVRDRLRRSRAL
jgi:glutathione synthase/RimK-type ligase-like ATP-grasp enzyme